MVSKDGIIISYSINSSNLNDLYNLEKGISVFEVTMQNQFQPGSYDLTVGVHFAKGVTIDYLEHIYPFDVLNIGKGNEDDYLLNWQFGYINLPSTWKKNN